LNLSIVVTCFNKLEFIPEFIEHSRHLLNRGCELVVIDDCSTDGSLELLRRSLFSHNGLVFIELNQNLGSAHARNIGISRCTKSYIFFLDIDDFCYIDEIESALELSTTAGSDLFIGNLRALPENSLLEMPFKSAETALVSLLSVSQSLPKIMGYSRYIYSRDFILRNSIRFFPERHESLGFQFILDDAFWILYISALEGSILVSNPNIVLYRYNKREMTSESWNRYLDQVELIPYLVGNFLLLHQGMNPSSRKRLWKNTIKWAFEAISPLAFKRVRRSGMLSFRILTILCREGNPWSLLMFYIPRTILKSLKVSVRLRSRIKVWVGF
jgi:glycosyltransferase involved in cell wall biosynthesis